MIVLLSPAKTFNENAISGEYYPLFLEKSLKLVSILKTMNIKELESTLNISNKLASEVYSYYSNYELKYAASYLYGGQAYRYLKAHELDNNKLKNLYILSPLYGIVNALDNISLYRLDPKDKILKTSLYDYWFEDINNYIKSLNSRLIINLSSGEFSRFLDLENPHIITINFGIVKDNKLVQQSMLIKKMRGMMANHLLANNINNVSEIKDIKLDGFMYNENYSNTKLLMFTTDK